MVSRECLFLFFNSGFRAAQQRHLNYLWDRCSDSRVPCPNRKIVGSAAGATSCSFIARWPTLAPQNAVQDANIPSAVLQFRV